MARKSTKKMWSDAIKQSVRDRAPALLKSLRDDRTGVARLTPGRRHAARLLLRKVMTSKQIEDAVGPKRPAIKKSRTPKSKSSKKSAKKR